MAEQEKKGAGVSPAEDIRGRPTTVRGEPEQGLPQREAGGERREEEENEVNPRGRSDEERDARERLNAIPDGDGPRSDRGTNPLPEHYWDAKPDGSDER